MTSINSGFYNLCMIRLYDRQAAEDRVQTSGSRRAAESAREAVEGEEDVGHYERGDDCFV